MSQLFTVQLLEVDQVEAYCATQRAADLDSGVGGQPHSHAYPRAYPYVLSEAIVRTRKRWQTPLTTPGWRRGWGAFRDGEMAGSLHLAGGDLPSSLHRVNLGMGLLPQHRGLGGGRALLEAAIDWAKAEPQIAWIDLGVFDDNPVAHSLYERCGFHENGRRPDCFRVDGVIIENISMTLFVG